MTAKTVLGIVPGLQATALVGANLKSFDMKKSKQMSLKKITKLGVKNIVGVGLIGATAGMVNDLP